MFQILLQLTINEGRRKGDNCMVASFHTEVASWLPKLGHWVPGEDRGEVVTILISTTGDEEDIADQGSSKQCPARVDIESSRSESEKNSLSLFVREVKSEMKI